MGATLSIVELTKRYGSGAPAVDAVSLELSAGEFLTLLGASGSGKTTTLMMVAGFTPPDAGDIVLNGSTITHLAPERRGIGVVFQNYALFPHMTAARNVAFPLRMRGINASEATKRAATALDRVGLGGFGARLPAQLSGGQQQRVALARALVFEPGLLLMDEPLGALDRALRESMKAEIRRLHRELGITVLYVTHDQEEAVTLSDRIALMNRGRFVQIGSPTDLYERPIDAFVAGFIGESTLIDGTVVRDDSGAAALLPKFGGRAMPARLGPVKEGEAAVILLRPEKLVIRPTAANGTGYAAAVEDSVYIGDITRLTLRLESGDIVIVKQPNRADIFQPKHHDRVHIEWAREDAVLLPAGNI